MTFVAPAVQTSINKTQELVHIHVNGEEIVCTPEHPFYSPVLGWTVAIHLRAGDILVLVNGEYAVVEQVQHEILEAPISVYNFEVEGFHTYYVGNDGVLVHNSCSGAITQTYNQLRKIFAGSGLEVHHILEKRFAPVVGFANKEGSMLSVALTKTQHREFTNAWRNAIKYGESSSATPDTIWAAAQTVYANYPELLAAAKITIFGG